MQYSHTQYVKKVKGRLLVAQVLKVAILIAIGVYIFWQFRHKENLHEEFQRNVHYLWTGNAFIVLAVPLLLMPLNWAIEALKWKMLAKKVEKISFGQAFKGVLTGLSLGFITPRGVGGYAGRIWQLNQQNRTKAVGAIMLGRLAQFFCTLIFGCIGLSVLLHNLYSVGYAYWIGMSCLFFSIVVFLLFLLNGRKGLIKISIRLLGSRATGYFRVLKKYSKKEVIEVIGLSALRYAVFSFQFLWILYLFQFKLSLFALFAGVTWIFIAKSIIPAFNFLSDLGVREFSALYFFSAYPVDNTKVITASLII